MEVLRIVGLFVVGAVVYGILHDLVTAHLCVEYFTIGHPRVIESENPVQLALVWGVLATWWVGLLAGLLVAIAARLGGPPHWTARQVARPLAWCLVAMGAGAAIGGILGRLLAEAELVVLVGPLREQVPEGAQAAFLGNLWAHTAAYGLAAILMLGLAWHVVRRRRAARR